MLCVWCGCVSVVCLCVCVCVMGKPGSEVLGLRGPLSGLGLLSKVHCEPPCFPSHHSLPGLQNTEKIIFIKGLTYPITIYKIPSSHQPSFPGAEDPETNLLPSISLWMGLLSSTPTFLTCPAVALGSRQRLWWSQLLTSPVMDTHLHPLCSIQPSLGQSSHPGVLPLGEGIWWACLRQVSPALRPPASGAKGLQAPLAHRVGDLTEVEHGCGHHEVREDLLPRGPGDVAVRSAGSWQLGAGHHVGHVIVLVEALKDVEEARVDGRLDEETQQVCPPEPAPILVQVVV